MKKKKAGEIIDNAYFELVRRFPQKPIASDRAIHTVNELVDRGFENLTHGEEAYLDVLSDLVEKYENAHHSIPDASPVAMLKFFIADRNTNQRAVALGSGFGDFFFLRDFDIRDGLLNRRHQRSSAFRSRSRDTFLRPSQSLSFSAWTYKWPS